MIANRSCWSGYLSKQCVSAEVSGASPEMVQDLCSLVMAYRFSLTVHLAVSCGGRCFADDEYTASGRPKRKRKNKGKVCDTDAVHSL